MYFPKHLFLVSTLFLYSTTLFAAQGTRSRVAAAAKQKVEHDRQEAERLYQEKERSRKNELRSSLPCLEELSPQILPSHSLLAHIEHWPVLIKQARSAQHSEAEVICMCGVKLRQFQDAWQNQRDSFYVVLRKEVGDGKIEFHDYYNYFVAENVAIQSIGIFLNPIIASGLKAISLEHNQLTSFAEIREKIIAQCPLLVTLKLGHNRLTGELSIAHATLSEFSVAHNNFSSLGEINLPVARVIDFRFNNICFMDLPYLVLGSYHHSPVVFDSDQHPDDATKNFVDSVFNM